MPTYNRRHFVPRAVEYFLCQDYKSKELLIVDDGTDPVADLIPDDPSVRYVRLEKRLTVGAKRNLACSQSRGEIIAHWDDDDWHAPHRLGYQVGYLLGAHAELCGINTLLFYDMTNSQAWQYVYPKKERFWLSGSTLCYRRSFWKKHRFPKINVGEDTRFVWSGWRKRMVVLPESTFHIGVIHQHNVSLKRTRGPYWRTYPLGNIQNLMGHDWDHYQPEPLNQSSGETAFPEC
jgi:glycosyltransferase involved in cell wall biosynthesis